MFAPRLVMVTTIAPIAVYGCDVEHIGAVAAASFLASVGAVVFLGPTRVFVFVAAERVLPPVRVSPFHRARSRCLCVLKEAPVPGRGKTELLAFELIFLYCSSNALPR